MQNWKTTAAGAVGLLTAVIPQAQTAIQGGHVDWKQVAMGFVFGLIGLFAKDHNN